MWLNNPRRPLEASGTSGQKVVLNGGLNLSVLDGWWAEAYDGLNGFGIGTGKTHSNPDIHDLRDGEDLYRTLREEVIPLYYQRDRDGLPRGWIKRMKRTIRTLGWRFNADRMVMDYVLKCYVPAAGGRRATCARPATAKRNAQFGRSAKLSAECALRAPRRRYVPNARARMVFCSISWAPCEPVAGLALAERFTDSTARPRARRSRRGHINVKAPIFPGSSCTQTNSRAFA